MKLNEITNILGGKSDKDTTISQLLTDSRNLIKPEETLFFALKTAGNDGHKYIKELYDKGVRAFVVEDGFDTAPYPDATFWIVKDVLKALQEIAKDVRSKFANIPVIGITGSRGKTITKELLNQILIWHHKPICRSPRSFNSQIGVPLSIWEINANDNIAIFEAGISQPSEMAALEEMIKPTIGVFTNLTDEHQAAFDSLSQKAREKAKLFKDCKNVFCPDNPAIIQAIKAECPNARIHIVEGGLIELAENVAQFIDDSIIVRKRLRGTNLEKFVPRYDACETLKNCLIVYDCYTCDARSIKDTLNYARRHANAERSLTLIVSKPDDDADLNQLVKDYHINRLITIGIDAKLGDSADCIYESYSSEQEFLEKRSISDFSNELIVIKGSPFDDLQAIKAALEEPRHETIMEVNLGAITNNFNYYRSLMPKTSGMVAMVKAAGYGVGAIELARTLQSQGAAYLAVAVVDEGAELRRAGITMPIIVMNPMSTNYQALFENKLEPSVFSLRELDLLLENASRLGIKDYPVHIKLDTGMHRLGFIETELDALIERLNSQDNVKVSSIFSHLATADCLDQDEYTMGQLNTFEDMSSRIMAGLNYPVKRHILNTAGMMRFPEYHYDMSRLGIGLYGVSPIEQDKDKLQVVARLTTTIISLKHWEPGATIGYGRRGKITKPSEIATIPIGYADGLDRHLGNGNAYVLINGVQCPIIGNICMDQCMVDVTTANAKIGDKVEIFGENAPVERLSDTLGTIPYEILTSISPRVKRIYFRE